MSIIKEKVIASKSGNIDEAKSLVIIMNGTNAVDYKDYRIAASEIIESEQQAILVGNIVEKLLPILYSKIKK